MSSQIWKERPALSSKNSDCILGHLVETIGLRHDIVCPIFAGYLLHVGSDEADEWSMGALRGSRLVVDNLLSVL